jgi:hypothetical protein
MAGFLLFLSDDPNISPYTNTSYMSALATSGTGLMAMQSAVLAGTLDPTLAQLRVMSYIATYAPICSYYYCTDFVYQMQRWTTYTAGPAYANLWDGIIPYSL